MKLYWPIGLIVLSNVIYQICAKSTPAKINPLAALIVTYLVAAAAAALLYFVLTPGGNLLGEYAELNWSSPVLGVVIVGLEVGCIYMYKAGWDVSAGYLVHSSILAVALLLVGLLLYHEVLSWNRLLGVLCCLVGVWFLNK